MTGSDGPGDGLAPAAPAGEGRARGLVLALGMLTKPPFAVYLLPPLLWTIWRVVSARERRRRLALLLLALLIGGAVALPWYGPRLLGIPMQISQRSFKQAAEEGKAEALKAGQQDLFAARPDPRTGRTPTFELGAPRVIVSSQPTALVLVDGQPGFQSVPGTELSRLVNSESVMFRHDVDGQLYLQVGERWYRAASTNGPWRSVSDAQLPAGIAVALQAAR